MDVSTAGQPGPTVNPAVAATVYWLLTIATVVRAGAEILGGFVPSPGLRVLITVGGLGQLLGAALFAINIWWRVRLPAAAREPT